MGQSAGYGVVLLGTGNPGGFLLKQAPLQALLHQSNNLLVGSAKE